MKRSMAILGALAVLVSACGSGLDESRNVAIPSAGALARILPLGISFAPGQTAAVAAAGNQEASCVIDHQGGLWCWGRRNDINSVGMPDVSNVPVRIQIPGGLPVTAVSSGDSPATCAVSGGRVYCWGANWSRQAVPTNAARFVTTPTLVEGLTDVVDVVTTYRTSCARKTNGSVWCWGSFESYGLGGEAFLNRTLGGPIDMRVPDATDIVGADDTYCVVKANGTMTCWGRNLRGTTGVGNLNPVLNPTPVVLAEAVIDIWMSSLHTCVALVSGAVQCWGQQVGYQIGNAPANSYILNPFTIDLRGDRAIAVAVGMYTSCMLTDLNVVKCWGMAPGTNNTWWSIVTIPNMTNVMSISMTPGGVLCAVQWTGEVRCAGKDVSGSLGDGGEDIASSSAVKIGSFGTAGVAAVTTSTAAPSTTTVTTTTVVNVSTIPAASNSSSTVPGVTTTVPSPASTAPTATTTGGGLGVDATGSDATTQVSVPLSVAPGAVARVLVIKKGRSVSDATVARFAGVGTPKKSKVTVTVAKASKKFCARNGAKITGARPGRCTLTVKVTPKGQKPRVRVVTAQVIG